MQLPLRQERHPVHAPWKQWRIVICGVPDTQFPLFWSQPLKPFSSFRTCIQTLLVLPLLPLWILTCNPEPVSQDLHVMDHGGWLRNERGGLLQALRDVARIFCRKKLEGKLSCCWELEPGAAIIPMSQGESATSAARERVPPPRECLAGINWAQEENQTERWQHWGHSWIQLCLKLGPPLNF